MSCQPLSDAETRQVVELVKPVFREFLSKYDLKKYPPDVYLRACQEPESVPTASDLDKFLMMHGKAIKAEQAQNLRK